MEHPRVIVEPFKAVQDPWALFLRLAARRVPEMWHNLLDGCFPLWVEEKPGLQAALRAWCERWHLLTPDGEPHPQALSFAGLNFLRWLAVDDPQKRRRLYAVATAAAPQRREPLPEKLREITFRARWNPDLTGEPIHLARARVLREFEAALDAHIEEFIRHARGNGCLELPLLRGDIERAFRQFVEFQLAGRSVAEILEDEPELDERSLRKRLAQVAELLGLRLRQDRRGRKARG